MGRLIHIVDEKAQFSSLESRKAKLEGLLRFAIAEDHDSMARRHVQSIYFHVFSDWPSYRLLRIDFHREFCRVTKETGSRKVCRLFRNWRDANRTQLGFSR